MPKILCMVGIAIAGFLLVIFGLDLAIGFPFGKASTIMDIGFVVSSLMLAYLSWTTLREQG